LYWRRRGTVFKLASDGTESVLYSFKGTTDGASPYSSLIADSAGNFYGTTYAGGGTGCSGNGCGTVYKLASDGTESVLYAFQDGADGAQPYAPLVMDKKGNLYGTVPFGGTGCSGVGCGTVFKVSAKGIFTVLYSFTGGSDGADPYSGVFMDKKGNLYGAAASGGTANSDCDSGYCGTVFKLSPAGTLTVLYAFKGGSDGANPSLALTAGKNGEIYGPTYYGGDYTNCPTYGCGTIFKLAADGSKTTLYSFTGESDGLTPGGYGVSVDKSGNLFVTTIAGGDFDCGSDGCGTLDEISAKGAEKTLHTFTDGKDGAFSYSRPLIGKRDKLYGTAEIGGTDNANCAYGCGVVYELKP